MTLEQLYKKTKAWMFEKNSSTIYDNYIGEIANKVFAEVYDENNMCRMFNGLQPLTSIPQIDTSSSTYLSTELGTSEGGLGFMDEYLLDVIPKGIDANFLMDDDLNKMSIYQTEYNNARVMHQKMLSTEAIEELLESAED